MAGEIVPLASAGQRADEETKEKIGLLRWANDIADAVLQLSVTMLRSGFLIAIVDDDEELASLDLKSDYDPMVDDKTGARLSEAIKDAVGKFRRPEKMLRRLYMSALRRKWEEQRAEIPNNPVGTPYGKLYMVTRHGVWTRFYLGGSGLSDPYVWRRICRTRIHPQALSRDTSPQRNWRHQYLVIDETGQFPVEINAEHLAKKADRAIAELMRHGVHVVETPQAREHLAGFLRHKPRARVVRVPRTGWFEARRDSWVFVLPTETLGDAGKVGIVLDGVLQGYGLHRSGTSKDWRQRIAMPLAGNSNIIFAVGVFLAAPLLVWADEPGGGFHLCGPAKIGKTLVGAVAQSIWGKPFKPGAGADAFGFTWETTASRLGERAVLRSDIGLYLDEIGIGDPKAIATAVYKLAGGLDKGRWRQAERDFNILILSTGELPLAEFLPNVRQGQLVRLVHVPAVVKSESGFETIPKDQIAAAGRQFYAATAEVHGSVGYDWLHHLVALTPSGIKTKLKQLRKAWLKSPEVGEIVSRAHPQVVSVINRFALVAAALTMAVEAGILPWSNPEIDAAVVACMTRWLNQRGNIDAAGELLREIQRRLQTIAATIGDRFIRLNLEGRRLVPASVADQHKMAAAEGFDGYIKDGRILVTPDAWRRLWAGLDADAVKKQLLSAKLLIPGRDGAVPSLEKFKSGEQAARFYVLTPAFVDVTA
jgi:uncharacterized protein (DUF927 family)